MGLFSQFDPGKALRGGGGGGGGSKSNAVQDYLSGDGYYADTPGTSYGGTEFRLGQGAKGFSPQINLGFLDAAGMITSGSRSAENLLTRAYEDAYAHRAGGVAGGYDEFSTRMGAQGAAQGYSPEILDRIRAGSSAGAIQEQGQARSELGSDFYQKLAELAKNTGTELTDLKLSELEAALQAFLGYKARKAGRAQAQAAQTGAIIKAGGMVAGGVLGGPAGAAAVDAATTAAE